ncbi:MAG: hypothetical protein COA31_006480 [Flavobacteriales bacterium]|nr:hypothetical protein [Flavobacteriales bacterium]
MAAQLNFPVSDNRFITITYQSNDYLNEELDNKTKQEIAKILVEKLDIKKIHSYIHGQIIIEVNNTNIITTLKDVISELAEPLASKTPPLLYSVMMVPFTKDTPPKNLIYVDGNADMNNNFLASIDEFYPKIE